MEQEIVFGDGWLRARLPDDTHVVSPGLTLPLAPADDLASEVRGAIERPLDGPALGERARGARRVTIAFDDATVPCYAPVWQVALPILMAELERAGVPRERIHLVCANALHRKFDERELGSLIGDDLVRELAPSGRLTCHDAEAPGELELLGSTSLGEPVEISRLVTETDLCIYLNTSTMRGFSGGWKSICVGLSSYRSISAHHTPDTMSMTSDKNRMHESLDRMGELVEQKLGAGRIFKLETVLANPIQVHRIVGGSVAATRRFALELVRANQPLRRSLLAEKVDVVLYGIPDYSPYAAFSFTNPMLTLVSSGLGYLGGMIEALGKPGCTAILATPCPDRWDDVHHPSYREVWDRVLPQTRDPFEIRERFEPELATRADFVARYRTGFGFHPTHAAMALYPLKRLRHASRVIVAGAHDPALVRHVGFEPAETVEKALAMAAETHGPSPSIAFVRYPAGYNRQ